MPSSTTYIVSNTTLVNIKDLRPGWQKDPKYVYIGRKNWYFHVNESPYHNPFPLNKLESRESILDKFKEYILKNPKLIAKAKKELPGKILVCWCYPEKCHGNILIDLIGNTLV